MMTDTDDPSVEDFRGLIVEAHAKGLGHDGLATARKVNGHDKTPNPMECAVCKESIGSSPVFVHASSLRVHYGRKHRGEEVRGVPTDRPIRYPNGKHWNATKSKSKKSKTTRAADHPVLHAAERHAPVVSPWSVDDIVLPVVAQLHGGPHGTMPVASLAAVLVWRDATEAMMATVLNAQRR
jgi:hypothetical protein